MTDEADREVLWLRSPKEREKPPSSYALLWPAAEYTALIFGQAERSDIALDPFERAVLGAAGNGLIEIKRQAELLNLNEGFVGHLQECLRDRGLLDDGGRVRAKADELLSPQSHIAVRLYQDVLTGNLWPRFVTEQRRRTLPVDIVDGHRTLIAGLTGHPVHIRSFSVQTPSTEPPAPTSDDAALAVRTWTRFRSRIRVGDFTIPPTGPIKLLPDSRQFVYLCCPSRRSRSGNPDVDDPFGGPTWAPFVRALVERSGPGQPLGRWLYGDRANDDGPTVARAEVGLTERISRLTDRAESAGRAEVGQLLVDLDESGHVAVDRIWSEGTEDVEAVLLDRQSDSDLIRRACGALGFEAADVPAGADLRSAVEGSGTLIDRCAALLVRYPIDREGPMQRLAVRCPDLFPLLRRAAHDRRSLTAVTGLATAVIALGETTTNLDVPTNERETDRG